MRHYPQALEKLSEQFAKLPGIGRKSAQRLAYYLLSVPEKEAEAFAEAILEAKRTIRNCPICQNLTDSEVCPICSSPKRDASVICVVAEPKDVIAIERTGEFNGRHVGPDDLKIKELLGRISSEEVSEVIMATNPDTEGEATAMYVSRLLRPLGVKVTRLAYGIPVGSNLEYADSATLMRALEGRIEM